jgi:hypothetical protein
LMICCMLKWLFLVAVGNGRIHQYIPNKKVKCQTVSSACAIAMLPSRTLKQKLLKRT